MNAPVALRVLLLAFIGGAPSSALSAVTVDEQVVAPTGPDVKYVVSDRGVHFAAITRKGSRQVVMIDGNAGPRIDAVITPTLNWIDPRPYQSITFNRGIGRHQADEMPVRPVLFSKDGTHSAYIAKISQDYIVYLDQKEILRLPGGANSAGAEHRLAFSDPSGKHLLFARASGEGFGYELWVDGQKWPGYFTSGGGGSDGTVDPFVSFDGEHIAYVATITRDKQALIIDAKEAPYFGKRIQFTPDSRHLVSIAESPKGHTLLLDGKPLLTAAAILSVIVSPDSRHIATIITHELPDHTRGQALLMDGKLVPATVCRTEIKTVLFSPDSKRYAAVCSDSPALFFVVSDGKKQQEYDGIGNPVSADRGIAFSPDSSRLVYLAHGAGKNFLIINGEESDEAFENPAGFRFSPNGKRFVYTGFESGQNKSTWVIDGKRGLYERSTSIDFCDFSPDGSRLAFLGPGNYGGPIYVDGKLEPITAYDFAFSDDGKHVAITGYNPADNSHGLWLDGNVVYKGERHPEFVAFSHDSQHVFWTAMEPASGPNAQPGTWEIVTYADGKPAARCENNSARTLMMPLGYSNFTIHPGWQTSGDSGIAFVGLAGDSVKRVTITPTDSNIASLLSHGSESSTPPAADGDAKPKRPKPANSQTPNPASPPTRIPTSGTPASVESAVRTAGQVANDPKGAAIDAAAQKAKEKADAAARKAKAWLEGLGNKTK